MQGPVQPAPSAAPAVDAGASTSAAADPDEEGPSGPSVFISNAKYQKAAVDVKLVDARQLVVAGQVPDDETALQASASITAFAREAKVRLLESARHVGKGWIARVVTGLHVGWESKKTSACGGAV